MSSGAKRRPITSYGVTVRALRSVSTRLAILFFIVLIPVSSLASLLAWENFRVDVSEPQEQAARVEAALGAAQAVRARARGPAAAAIATALRQAPEGACGPILALVQALDGARFTGLAERSGGGLRCVAGSVPTAGSAGSPIEVAVDGGRALLAWTTPDADLPTLRTHAGARLWRVGATGVLPLDRASSAELPPAARLEELRRGTAAAGTWRDAAGRRRAYAIGPPGAAMRLLVSLPASRAVATARAVFARRIAEIVVLLLLGLVAVATMTEYAVTRPLRRLTASVGVWRVGGVFNPRPTRFMPAELAALRDSFAQASAALAEQEQQLRGALARQDLLLHEVHHRVKNNLQIVASLLSLQGSRIQQPEAKAEFSSARDRVRALATLHRHLYAHGELQTINMRSFLSELCGQMFQALGEVPGQRIALELDAPELEISSDQAVPLSLLITEAVGNALKHGFPDGRSGVIRVLMAVSAEVATLTIADDGVGAGVAAADRRRGIGLQLMRGFARQLGATLEPRGGAGTAYRIEFRLEAPRRHLPGPATAEAAVAS